VTKNQGTLDFLEININDLNFYNSIEKTIILKMNVDIKNYKSSDKASLLRKIKKILQEKSNLIVFIILSIAVLYAIMVRFINLGELSFWGDDGMTYLS